MSIRIGYLLPTRERVMAEQPQAASLLELAERAERLGFDSVWAGDSLLARPRHEPLTLLLRWQARVRRVDVGTAVLLPALITAASAPIMTIGSNLTAPRVIAKIKVPPTAMATFEITMIFRHPL